MIKTTKKGQWYEIIVPDSWSTFTVDHLLRNVWRAPKKLIHTIRMEKKLLINGEIPNWDQLLVAGEKLQLNIFQPEKFEGIPSYQDVDVLFEDEHLLVLNKPADMDTHPNESQQEDTLLNGAAFHLQANGENLKPRHIHRLDRETTGAVLFAKTHLASAILDRLLEERKIKRTYLAITDGIIAKKKGTINKPIGRDRHHPVRRRVSHTGQPAITHYEVLKYFKNENKTLIRCSLDTGRTHQIRVHLSDINHPLSGDVLYGGTDAFSRQALHAVKMDIPHPFTGEIVTCHAPFLDNPPIFKQINPFNI